MNPNMSVAEMLDRFIYIVKGSRVIDRKAVDWGRAYWLDERYVKGHVYTVAELKRYFAHRVSIKFKKYPRFGSERIVTDPFGSWLTHPHRFTTPALDDAMLFADAAVRGLFAPRIELDAMVARATKPLQPPWVRAA
jgi:hypothetical protein